MIIAQPVTVRNYHVMIKMQIIRCSFKSRDQRETLRKQHKTVNMRSVGVRLNVESHQHIRRSKYIQHKSARTVMLLQHIRLVLLKFNINILNVKEMIYY